MYKIADEKFQSLYLKYHVRGDYMTDYAYYLKSVKEDGTALFDVPQEYQTNELIMIALESSDKPIHLMTRWSLEMCISNHRENLSSINQDTDSQLRMKNMNYIYAICQGLSILNITSIFLRIIILRRRNFIRL